MSMVQIDQRLYPYPKGGPFSLPHPVNLDASYLSQLRNPRRAQELSQTKYLIHPYQSQQPFRFHGAYRWLKKDMPYLFHQQQQLLQAS